MRTIFRKKNLSLFHCGVISIFVLAIILSLGFCTIANDLLISASSEVRAHKQIRVSKISVSSMDNGAYTRYVDYDNNTISFGVDLPYENSTATYEIEVTNLGNSYMAISELFNIPDNLSYELIDYQLKDVICNNNDECNLGIKKIFYIKLKNKVYNENDYSYNANISLKFSSVYNINYVNFDNDDVALFPKTAMEGETFVVDFPSNVESMLIYSNKTLMKNSEYSFEDNRLTIADINDDVTIKLNNMLINSGSLNDGGIEFYALGNSTYKINGTVNYWDMWIRLTDVMNSTSDHYDGILDDNYPYTTIIPSGSKIKYVIEVIGGSFNIPSTSADKFKLTGRKFDNTVETGFDFNDNPTDVEYIDIIENDVAAFVLYLKKDCSFNNFIFKINIDIVDSDLDILEGKQQLESILYSVEDSSLTITRYEDNYFKFNGILKRNAGNYFYISLEPDNLKIVSYQGSLLYNSSLASNPKYLKYKTYKIKYIPYNNGVNKNNFDQVSILFRDTSSSVGAINYCGKMSTSSSNNVYATTKFNLDYPISSVGTLTSDASMISMFMAFPSYDVTQISFNNWVFKLEVTEE